MPTTSHPSRPPRSSGSDEQAGLKRGGYRGAWPTYEPTRRETMVFGREAGVESAPREPERAIWDEVVV